MIIQSRQGPEQRLKCLFSSQVSGPLARSVIYASARRPIAALVRSLPATDSLPTERPALALPLDVALSRRRLLRFRGDVAEAASAVRVHLEELAGRRVNAGDVPSRVSRRK